MVEVVSNGSIEGGILTSASIEEFKVEETPKKESAESIDSKGALKEFLKNGGAKQNFRELLITLYGKKLIDRSFPKGWKERLSQGNCLEILERIGHSLTLEDLEGFYAELKSGIIKSKVLNYAMVPYLRMWWSGSVRELPPYWLGHLIGLFRNPLKELKLDIEVEKIDYIDRGVTAYTHYSHQVNRLQKKGDRSRPEFFYASRELLAKSVAYAAPKSIFDGAIIPVFNVELDRQVFYILKGQIHHSGLHAYLFVPLEKGNEFPAQLIFRGTNGYASVGRDLDSQGVGKRVFTANSDKIEALIREAKTNKIEFIGHSLGAADAQRGFALLVDPKKGFNFKEISLYAFCAPKLEIERVNQWKSDLKALTKENKRPVIRLNFAYHESDVVTWTGDSYLSGAEVDFIYSNYLTVKSYSGAMQTSAHHTTSFFLDGNFNFKVDGRIFEFRKSFPNAELDTELQKLQEIENSWQWWLGAKSYFVKLESKEEIEKRVEEMKRHQADISVMEKGGSQHSWLVYSGWSTVRYTVQPVVYYTFEGIRALRTWRR